MTRQDILIAIAQAIDGTRAYIDVERDDPGVIRIRQNHRVLRRGANDIETRVVGLIVIRNDQMSYAEAADRVFGGWKIGINRYSHDELVDQFLKALRGATHAHITTGS